MSPQSASMASGVQFGVRKQEGVSSPLKVSKDSHRIRKPPLPLPQVQYRPPIIIHTYSPKVIHTEPDDFMSLVQKLTGSSDTRLRLKKSPKKDKKENSAAASESSQSAAVANLERQGSGTSSVGSPTASEESSFLVSEAPAKMKQSNSPRSPLDSHFEFDSVSEAMFSHFDASAAGSPFPQQVKVEPIFPMFNDSSSFSFFADFLQPTFRAVPVTPPMPTTLPHMGAVTDQMQSTPTPGFLMNHGLQDLSPAAAWSQSFIDCLNAPAAPSYHQPPFPRQRFPGGYTASTTPESSTMVALENIHAFLST